MKTMPLFPLLAAVLCASWALAPRAWAKPITVFDDAKESKELIKAQRELKELEKKIKRKEIPPIEFEFNKAILVDTSKQTLNLLADLLMSYDDIKLMVNGHTCDIGSDEYNLWLSQKRAEAVKDYLVSVGVMGEYVRAKGYGEAHPVVPNDSEENRSLNRRVEFVLMLRWWEAVY